MTETVNVFILINIKCYVLRSSLFATKLKIICKNLVTKISNFFNWEITRLIQFHDCLFIEPRISWWSEAQTILTCTGHWPVRNSAKLNLYQFPLCHVASQLDVVTLSSKVFPSCTIQNNCGNFFNLDSRFAKADRRLGPVYMERLGGNPPVFAIFHTVTPTYHVNLIKLKWEIIWPGGLTTYTWTLQVFKMCTCGWTVYFHNHIWPTFVILTAFVFRSYCYYYFKLKGEKPVIQQSYWNEILSNSNSLSVDPIKWLFGHFYNGNLIIKSIIIYFTVCEIYWGKKMKHV